jgi:hypothetical protein
MQAQRGLYTGAVSLARCHVFLTYWGYRFNWSAGMATLVTLGAGHNPNFLTIIFADRTSHAWHFLGVISLLFSSLYVAGRLTGVTQLHGGFWQR